VPKELNPIRQHIADRDYEEELEVGPDRFPRPGKVTLTEQIAVSPPVLQADGLDAPVAPETLAEVRSSGGTPLPEKVRREWEAIFNFDFSDVRIHEDEEAERIGARAFARGEHIHFAPGRFDPSSESGKELLGHELTHVIQQKVGRVSGDGVNADSSLEGEAREQGRRAARGQPVQVGGSPATRPRESRAPRTGRVFPERAREPSPVTRPQRMSSPGAIQMDNERTVDYGDASNSRESGFGSTLQMRLHAAIPEARREADGTARDLYILLPAAAYILEAGLGEAAARDTSSRYHYSCYQGTESVDANKLQALQRFWEARWQAQTEDARRTKLRQGRRLLGNLLYDSTIRQTIRGCGGQYARRDGERIIELTHRYITDRFRPIEAGESQQRAPGTTAGAEGEGAGAGAGQSGGAAPSDGSFPGNRSGRGYRYLGTPTRGRTRAGLTRVAAYFRERDLEDYAVGTETFLRTMSREGYPSAINTWDGMVFTWGTGFAARGLLGALWEALDPAVIAALQALAPDRVSESGVRVTASIRTEVDTLNAFVQVTEGEHFTSILRSMLRTFLVHTMGLPEEPIAGSHLPISDDDQLYMSTRLSHHRPGLWNFGTDTNRAVALTGGVNPPDDTEYLAACIRVKTANAIRRGGGACPGGRRIQRKWTDEIFKWRDRRIPQWTRGSAGHDQHQVVITDRTLHLCPALTSSSAPYFTHVTTLEEIPENHLVAVEDPIGLDPENPGPWLQCPRAGKFFDMGPCELSALGPSGSGEAAAGEPGAAPAGGSDQAAE
jgi:hypothetical protein